MALITCSSCGKQVSDSREVCIHCGNPLSVKEAPKVSAKPTFEELQALEKEFDDAFPKYKADEASRKVIFRVELAIGISYLAFCLALLTSALLGFIFQIKISDSGSLFWVAGMISLAVAFILGIVGRIFLTFMLRNYRKKTIFRQKVFQRWLSEKKGITGISGIDKGAKEWEQRYFVSIDVSKEKL